MSRSLLSESPRHKDGERVNARSVKRVATMALLAACAHLPSQPQGPAEYWGFTGPWDTRSDASVGGGWPRVRCRIRRRRCERTLTEIACLGFALLSERVLGGNGG